MLAVAVDSLICLQVALTAVKDAIGAVSYVEFVLHPAPMFDTFVEVADKVLEAIQPAGGAQASEPQQQVRRQWSCVCRQRCCMRFGRGVEMGTTASYVPCGVEVIPVLCDVGNS